MEDYFHLFGGWDTELLDCPSWHQLLSSAPSSPPSLSSLSPSCHELEGLNAERWVEVALNPDYLPAASSNPSIENLPPCNHADENARGSTEPCFASSASPSEAFCFNVEHILEQLLFGEEQFSWDSPVGITPNQVDAFSPLPQAPSVLPLDNVVTNMPAIGSGLKYQKTPTRKAKANGKEAKRKRRRQGKKADAVRHKKSKNNKNL
ncbi:hypothetical protein QOT17_003667 [Balamuthia mandrillaris]